MRLDKFLSKASIGKSEEVRGYIEKRYYMFHKPMGCVTARSDKEHKTVFDYLAEEDAKGLFHVGRLDKDTEGLLFMTNDGAFEHKLMYPENHVCKTYLFWAIGKLSEEDIKQLEGGISIVNGSKITKPARVKILSCDSYEALKVQIDALCGKNLNYNNQYVTSGQLTISEGCKHQVKRMLKALGCYVVYLKRVSIGSVKLDEGLEKGQYRLLTKDEVYRLMNGI